MDFANQMKLSYTNIASILGICSDGEPYYVIYEYLDQVSGCVCVWCVWEPYYVIYEYLDQVSGCVCVCVQPFSLKTEMLKNRNARLIDLQCVEYTAYL